MFLYLKIFFQKSSKILMFFNFKKNFFSKIVQNFNDFKLLIKKKFPKKRQFFNDFKLLIKKIFFQKSPKILMFL